MHPRGIGRWRFRCAKPLSWQPGSLWLQHRHGARLHREIVMTSIAGIGTIAVAAGIAIPTMMIDAVVAAMACATTMTTIAQEATALASSSAAATRSFAWSAVIGNRRRPAWMQR